MADGVILLVDDDEPGRYVNARILRGAGYEVREAARGTQALEMVAREQPDLVILDISLPGISGSEVLRRIRSDPATAALPAVYLSATFADEASIAHGLTEGADAYLTKPVSSEVLLGQVQTLLRVGRMHKELRVARQEAERRAEEAERAEEALLQTEAELREAQRVAGVGSWYWDLETDAVTASEQVYRMLGLDPALPIPVLRGQEWQLYTPESQERVRAAVQTAIRAGGAYTLDVEARRADGAPLWLTARAEAVRGADGRIVGLRGTNQDITAQKRAEEALRESEARARDQAARWQAVLEAAPAMIWIASDPECRSISGNQTAHEFFRVPVGVDFSKTGPEPERLQHYRLFRDGAELSPEQMPIQVVARTGKALREYALGFVFEDGTARSVVGNVEPVLDKEGRPNGAIAAFIDITERERAEEKALAAERARAEIAENLSNEISHRVKNNLAMISGLLQMQQISEKDPNTILALRGAVSRIRTFADLHERMYASHSEEVDLCEVLRQVGDTAARVFARRDEVGIEVGGVPCICASRTATNLSVVANELVTNALKYGGPGADGRAQVHVRLTQSEAGLTLSVWNSGDPVPAAFDPGRQAGMGLRLVWDLVVVQYEGRFRLCPEGEGTLAEVFLPHAGLAADGQSRRGETPLWGG